MKHSFLARSCGRLNKSTHKTVRRRIPHFLWVGGMGTSMNSIQISYVLCTCIHLNVGLERLVSG